MLKKLIEAIAMTRNRPLATNDMVKFFEERTKRHIDGVRANIEKIMAKMPDLDKEEMLRRAEAHDEAKYSKAERIPYIHLTWAKKDDKDVPKRLNGMVRKAINHHFSVSRHHPEAHEKPSDMSKEDIFEMVSDWASVSNEKGGSLKKWSEGALKKYQFSKDQEKLIMSAVDVLENK